MRMLYLFLLLGFYSNAQMSYFVEYKGSVRVNSQSDNEFSNSLLLGIKRKNSSFSIGVGREDWKYNMFGNRIKGTKSFYGHCSTYKTMFNFNHNFKIPKTKISILAGVEYDLYFGGNLNDSLSLSFSSGKYLFRFSRNYLYQMPYNSSEYHGVYSAVSETPFSIKAHIALQYNFKKCTLRLYYEPYMMRFHYTDVKYADNKGKTFLFFNDIGIGLNYPLNFKKKQEKEK